MAIIRPRAETTVAQDLQALVSAQMPSTIGVGKELRELPDTLHDDEQAIYIMKASYIYSGKSKSGIFVVTNQRVMFVWMGLVRREFVDWPYERISSVAVKKGVLASKMTINAGGSEHSLNNVATRVRLDDIAAKIRELTRVPHPGQMHSNGAPAATSPDIATQIRSLGELRDQGLITPDEFETKKADLLAKL